MTRRRWPSPWEAAQITPPRGLLRRAATAIRITLTAALSRANNG